MVNVKLLVSLGTGVVGVPVRRQRCPSAGTGLQEDTPAAELARAVGRVAGGRRQPGAEATRRQPQLPQGRQTVPAQVVILQVGLIEIVTVNESANFDRR